MANGNVMTKEEWEGFIHGDVVNFMTLHDLQKITVDDGNGKKGTIRRGGQGEYKVQVVSNETI